jgi:alanine racemase
MSVIEINLSALNANYNFIKSFLTNNTKVAAVIKANAYGLGAKEILESLSETDCKDYCFAYVSEALSLKDKLHGYNVYIFNGITHEDTIECAINNYIPIIGNFYQLEIWKQTASKLEKKLPAILHVDTGMGRLGFSETQLHKIISNPELIEGIEFQYLMSHLACADERDHPLNKIQLGLIQKYSSYFPNLPITFANSAGILLSPNYHFSMVRPGCALYGINPNNDLSNPMKQVVTIKAQVLQIREIENDQNISYGGRYTARKGQRIAVLAFGYADGYIRIQTNNAFGYFKGYRIPIISTITMDLVMADITSIPEQLINEMDYVELMGENITVDEVAKYAKTIGYEVLTRLSNRIKRVYIK